MHITIFYSKKLDMWVYESINGKIVKLYPLCKAPTIKPTLKYRLKSFVCKLFKKGI